MLTNIWHLNFCLKLPLSKCVSIFSHWLEAILDFYKSLKILLLLLEPIYEKCWSLITQFFSSSKPCSKHKSAFKHLNVLIAIGINMKANSVGSKFNFTLAYCPYFAANLWLWTCFLPYSAIFLYVQQHWVLVMQNFSSNKSLALTKLTKLTNGNLSEKKLGTQLMAFIFWHQQRLVDMCTDLNKEEL